MYTIISSTNSDSFVCSFSTWVPFTYFSFLIAVARTSTTMLNRSGESRQPYLVPDLSRKIYSFCPLSIVEEGLEKWILLTHESGERKGSKGSVVHPDMTGKLASRLILVAHPQELNNLACSMKFTRGMEWPWLCIHLSLNLLGVYVIDNSCFLLWMHYYPPSFFSCSINMMRKSSLGTLYWCSWVHCFSSYHPDQWSVFVRHRSHCNRVYWL